MRNPMFMNDYALHEEDLARALEELAEIVEIICARAKKTTPPTTEERR